MNVLPTGSSVISVNNSSTFGSGSAKAYLIAESTIVLATFSNSLISSYVANLLSRIIPFN